MENSASNCIKSFIGDLFWVLVSAIIAFKTRNNAGEVFILLTLSLNLILFPALLLILKRLNKLTLLYQKSFKLLKSISIIFITCGISACISKYIRFVSFTTSFITLKLLSHFIIYYAIESFKSKKNAD